MIGHRGLRAAASRARGLQQGFKELCGVTAAGGTAAAAPCGLACAACQQPLLLPLAACAAWPADAAGRPWQAAAVRGYAKMGTKMPHSGYNPPADMNKAMQMRLSMVSPNLLAEPYRGVPPPQPLTSYFTIRGWKERWQRTLSQFKSMYTLAKCKKYVPGFNRNAFKQESLELYRDICRLLAQGERGSLRQLVTPAVFSDMKRQLKQREDGGWARVQWDLVREPTVDELTTVHGRLIMINPKDETSGFAQLTVRIPSAQRFAAYDKAGKLVAGDPEQSIDVEDYWVFEHAFKASPANRWRLAGRLSVLPHAAERANGGFGAAQQQQQAQPAAAHQQQAAPAAAAATAAAAGAAAAGEPEVLRPGHVAGQQRTQRQLQWADKPAGRKAAAARGRR